MTDLRMYSAEPNYCNIINLFVYSFSSKHGASAVALNHVPSHCNILLCLGGLIHVFSKTYHVGLTVIMNS